MSLAQQQGFIANGDPSWLDVAVVFPFDTDIQNKSWQGPAGWGSGPLVRTATPSPKFGAGAANFNGTAISTAISGATNLNLYGVDFTISYWIYATALPGASATILSYDYSSGSRGWELDMYSSSGLWTRFRGGVSGFAYPSQTGDSLELNQWNYIQIQFVAATGATAVWRNGTPKGGGTLNIGSSGGGSIIAGSANLSSAFTIDDLRITRRVLRNTTGVSFAVPTTPNPLL